MHSLQEYWTHILFKRIHFSYTLSILCMWVIDTVHCGAAKRRTLWDEYLQQTGIIFRHVCKIAKSDYLLCLICLCLSSVHMEHLVSHWTDFHEIWYLSIFRKSVKNIQVFLNSVKKIQVFLKSVKKIQVFLKTDKNNRYFTRKLMEIYDNISLNSS